ncbi:LMxysn_1693 family intestinal colonization protein [Bacillus cereus group sp. BfR-BA-01331]|uniref:LMxysn_1693 family intestinal colonization protein n=1 Tax=Bacillus cereus group sp. BfR-BA-01331 TaxID=2920307 RepID=UPI001F579ED6|nr:hypothetical protein [Bacillus cereus group sp. BfR-BA-01331]
MLKKSIITSLSTSLLAIPILVGFTPSASAEMEPQNTYEIEILDENAVLNPANFGVQEPKLLCATCNQYKSSIVSESLVSRTYKGTVTLSSTSTLSGEISFSYKGAMVKLGGSKVNSSSRKFKEYSVVKDYRIRVKTYNPIGQLISDETVNKRITTLDRVPV